MGKGKPIVNYKDCMACGICVSACPFSCLTLTKCDVDKYRKAYPELPSDGKCTGCGICENQCPIGSIKLH